MKVLPPLFVSFESVEALLAALPAATLSSHEQEIRSAVAAGLPPAMSMRTISTLFGVSPSFIRAMCLRPERYYRVFKIKKGKKTRTIHAPKVALKLFQSWFGSHLAAAKSLPDCVYGFVPGRSGVKEAAQQHCSARWVYSLDIRDFFPSITEEQVRTALCRLGYGDTASALIARLTTLNGRLPQGSPASPVLSNWVFAPSDEALISVAEELGVRYTRYADDLVFSGVDEPPVEIRSRVREIVTGAGWVIAEDKEHLAVLPARLKVHGLLVHGLRPRLTKGYRNKIRAFRHLLETNKVTAEDRDRLLGHLAYSDFIDEA